MRIPHGCACCAEQNYKQEDAKVQIQGVIAITTALMQRGLPLQDQFIPEFHECY
jgi:hypothetical protein